MDLSWIPDAVKVAGGAAGGGAVSAIFGYFSARAKVPSLAQDAVNRAVKTALDSTMREIDRLNVEIEKLKDSHKTEMEDCLRRHRECEDQHAKLREEVDRLLRLSQPAIYKPADLKRVRAKP